MQEGGHADRVEERALEAEAAGLGQDQERDVDRVDERVLVVRLQGDGGQHRLRRARHRVRQAPDELLDRIEAHRAFVADPGEQVPGHLDLGVRQAGPGDRGRSGGLGRRALGAGDLDLAHQHVGRRVGASPGRQRVDEGAALVEVQVPRQREPGHVAPSERADERLEEERPAAERPAVDDELVVEPDERERVLAALVAGRHHAVPELREGGDHGRVGRRVEGVRGERPRELGDQPLDRRLVRRRGGPSPVEPRGAPRPVPLIRLLAGARR